MGKRQQAQAVSDEEIIAALLSNSTIKDAAAAAGIATRTLYERMNDRSFKAAYTQAKGDIVRQAVFSINRKLIEAIDTVAEIMTDDKVNASVRLQAAQVIINNAGKFASRMQAEEEQFVNLANPSIWDEICANM